MTFFTEAASFIQYMGGIVASVLFDNPLSILFETVLAVFFTLKILGKLRYRENGG